MTTPVPKKPAPIAVPLSNGETVTIKAFTALDFLESPTLSAALAGVMEANRKLQGDAAMAGYLAYEKACKEAHITLQDAAELSHDEATMRGLVVNIEPVSTSAIIKACHRELSQILRASLSEKDDDWFETITLADLLVLFQATFKVNEMGNDAGNAMGALAPSTPSSSESKPSGETKRPRKARSQS